MNAIEYIDRYNKIGVLIGLKKEDYSKWFGIAAGVGGFSSSDVVQSTKNPQKMSDAVARYVEIDNEIEALREERDGIMKTINRLPYAECAIIVKFYIKKESIKQIARSFNMSYDWVKKRKKTALDHLQEILDEKKE